MATRSMTGGRRFPAGIREAWEAAQTTDWRLPDANGTVDAQAVARYRQTDTVVAERDCGPAGGSDGDDLTPEQPPAGRP